MGDGLLRRQVLLERLTRVNPRLVTMIAPAGFGKATLARQYLAERGGGAFIDAEGLASERDLAQRVEAALEGRPWESAQDVCVVFYAAEQIVADPSARALLVRLLLTNPSTRTVVLAARAPMRGLPVSRYARPHELVALRAADLAFDDAEVRALFLGLVEDDATLARIRAASQGWPIAVFLLRRFAEEGRLERLLDRPGDSAFHDLRDYLASEVVAHFDPPLREAIFACAAAGAATAEDLDVLAAQSPRELAEAMSGTGFVTISADGAPAVHSLLAAVMLQGRDAERERAVRALAAAHEAQAGAVRAAEIYAALGDRYEAARALGMQEVIAESAPTARYRAVLAKLDTATIARFPRLWGVHTLMRMFCVDSTALLDEAETVWRTLAPGLAPVERYYVLVFRVLFMTYLGEFDRAFAVLDEFAATAGAKDPPGTHLDGHLLYLRGLLRARCGGFDAAERDLNAALPLVDRMDVAASGVHLALGADIARVRGESSVERAFVTRARERAAASGLANFIAFDVAEALIGAWFAGDRTTFNQLAVELEALVDGGVAGFAYLAHVARGRSSAPAAADLPKFTVFAMLVALSRSRDEVERAALARDALARARRLRMPFVEALAAIAVALCEPARFDWAASIAQDAASRCDAPAFVHAVGAFAQQHGNVGMLAPFVTQITRDRSEAAPLAFDVLAGRVRVDGTLVRVSGRELELLAAIAQRREPTSRAKLASMMWPDLEEFAARNALSVCLHRLRAHLRREDAVERDVDGYRLHADAFVDLWEIERAAVLLRARDRLRDADRAVMSRALERLREERHNTIEGWEWFAPVLRRLDDTRNELAQRLASDALECGDPDAALAFAAHIIALDPCDEPAREIAIRAHLAVGDRAAALRQYRQYRDVLRQEFSAEPSAALTDLVMSA